jgi:putative membrane protein insertion efficiency factor
MVAKLALALIRAYQLLMAPVLTGSCRFAPSCSVYAVEAIRTHGTFRGSWLGLRRISKCHPFGPAGYDPVPPRPHR